MYQKNKLKGIRIGFGDTQDDIADLLGISVNTYRLRENGFRNFKLMDIQKIAEHYKLDLSEINEIFFNLKVYTKETKAE